MSELQITLVQSNLHWEDPKANLEMFSEKLHGIREKTDLIVLPEMFTTGFSMNAVQLAETMDGPAVKWMLGMSRQLHAVVTGSLIIRDQDKFFNRLVWAVPDGNLGTYDKRHLFSPGNEHSIFTPGNKRVIARLKGWKICLNICYDLRFPAWTSNQGGAEYDVLLYVANWPGKRNLAWNTLLQARAIENQSYVIGVNRVGEDGAGECYDGECCLIGPAGEIISKTSSSETLMHLTLSADNLKNVRAHFPFLNDGDRFLLLPAEA
jgi:omega-amidase